MLQNVSDRLNRLEAAIIRVEQSTQQASENIRVVSSQVYQVHDLVSSVRQGLANFTKTLAELLRPVWAHLIGDTDGPEIEALVV